jgi:phospholipase C
MMYFTPRLVPVTSFLAQEFCVCDRWFCSIPTSTTPNKTVAISGGTPIHDTKTRLIRNVENLIFDWLNANGIRWRVYHDGLSFFALYPAAWDEVLGRNFRDFEFLGHDFLLEPEHEFPSIVFVEPSYESVPHVFPDQPNDNHAPLPVGFGEEFLRRTYAAMRINPARWARTVLVITYDEHGGFWDHVPPPRIPLTTTGPDPFHFESLGPRVPAIVVSPLVERGSVCSVTLDHTSLLQFCAEVFTPGRPYSATVAARTASGIGSVSACMTRDAPRADRPAPPDVVIEAPARLAHPAPVPVDEIHGAFREAALQLLDERPAEVRSKYPELIDWRQSLEDR